MASGQTEDNEGSGGEGIAGRGSCVGEKTSAEQFRMCSTYILKKEQEIWCG